MAVPAPRRRPAPPPREHLPVPAGRRAKGPARERAELHHTPLHGAPARRDRVRFRHLHLIEALVALVLFAAALAWGLGLAQSLRRPLPLSELLVNVSPALTALDADGDGIADAEEDALLARFSPVGLLAGDEPCLPANIGWIRDHTALLGGTGIDVMGTLATARPFDAAVRRGSRNPADWTVYGHAYARSDGGVELQYWFYFPYNEGPLFFDHDSDWEHVSVELGADRAPKTFALSAHNDNAPGVRVPFEKVPKKDGTHPWFAIASGTHAAYLHGSDAPFWETVRDCPRDATGAPVLGACGSRVWASGADMGTGASPLVNVGERRVPRAGPALDTFFMRYPGMWGAAAPILGSAAPYGPPFQRGFCVDAQRGTCR